MIQIGCSTSLAAAERQQPVGVSHHAWATSPLKTRARDFCRPASGLFCSGRPRSRSIATGSKACVDKTASGLRRWPNRDLIEENGGVALYAAFKKNPLQYLDSLGLYFIGRPDVDESAKSWGWDPYPWGNLKDYKNDWLIPKGPVDLYVEPCEIVVLVGHRLQGQPHRCHFPKCRLCCSSRSSKGAFLGCWASAVNGDAEGDGGTIPKGNLVSGAPSWSGKVTVFTNPLRQQETTALDSQNPEGSFGAVVQAVNTGAQDDSSKILKAKCCKAVTISVLYCDTMMLSDYYHIVRVEQMRVDGRGNSTGWVVGMPPK